MTTKVSPRLDGRMISISASVNDAGFPVGSTWPLEGGSAAARVYETGRPAQIDDFSDLPGEIAAQTRGSGFTSAAAAPVTVDGTVWGVFCVAATGPDPLPVDTLDRLVGFGDLVATAVSNAEARDHVRGLLEEQAALRRVATLVAEGATTAQVGSAVLEEATRVLGAPAGWLLRYLPERSMSIVAALTDPSFPVGSTWPIEGQSVTAAIFETREPARIDDFSELEGPIAARFLEACGLSDQEVEDAERDARLLAERFGGVVLHVVFGNRLRVEVLPRNVESIEAASRRVSAGNPQ